MHVAVRGRDRLVSGQVLNLDRRRSTHRQVATERVPQSVPLPPPRRALPSSLVAGAPFASSSLSTEHRRPDRTPAGSADVPHSRGDDGVDREAGLLGRQAECRARRMQGQLLLLGVRDLDPERARRRRATERPGARTPADRGQPSSITCAIEKQSVPQAGRTARRPRSAPGRAPERPGRRCRACSYPGRQSAAGAAYRPHRGPGLGHSRPASASS